MRGDHFKWIRIKNVFPPLWNHGLSVHQMRSLNEHWTIFKEGRGSHIPIGWAQFPLMTGQDETKSAQQKQ